MSSGMRNLALSSGLRIEGEYRKERGSRIAALLTVCNDSGGRRFFLHYYLTTRCLHKYSTGMVCKICIDSWERKTLKEKKTKDFCLPRSYCETLCCGHILCHFTFSHPDIQNTHKLVGKFSLSRTRSTCMLCWCSHGVIFFIHY